jgi:hypothetical protein
MNNYNDWVGKQIVKRSKKPFKSTLKIGTVKSLDINPNTNKQAFSFLEDDSLVDCQQCKLLEVVNE